MSEMNTEPIGGQEEEKKPFYKTPLGIILITIGIIILCCCLSVVLALATGAPILEEVMNDPEFQQIFEEMQATIDANE